MFETFYKIYVESASLIFEGTGSTLMINFFRLIENKMGMSLLTYL